MRTINFYEARDELNRELLRGSDMPLPARAIFRYLLESAMFSGEAYGWVRHDACGVKTIAAIVGLSERAVVTHLQLLEGNGLVRRRRRARGTLGRVNDEIRIEWDFLYQDAPGARESGASTKADQDAPGASTTQYTEKVFTEPGQAREADVIDMTRRIAHV